MTARPAGQAGFTLIEVLLAVLIAGLVMVGSYSVASQVMRLSDEASARLDLETATAVVRLALAGDLGSIIYVEKGRKAVSPDMAFVGGQDAAGLSGQGDALLFSLATAASLDPGLPFPSHGFSRVEYVLRPQETQGGDTARARRLVRRDLPAATVARRPGAPVSWNETVLLEALDAVSLRFYPGADASPLAAWDSRARERARQSPLPAQVRLAGTVLVSGRSFPLDLRINLPARTLAAGSRP